VITNGIATWNCQMLFHCYMFTAYAAEKLTEILISFKNVSGTTAAVGTRGFYYVCMNYVNTISYIKFFAVAMYNNCEGRRQQMLTFIRYEECRLLGYRNPVRTSQETHYVSTTEPSQSMLCKNWGFTGVTMKNVVFWDIKTQFVPHRRHITSPLQSPAS
jgi:hypothetical protein